MDSKLAFLLLEFSDLSKLGEHSVLPTLIFVH